MYLLKNKKKSAYLYGNDLVKREDVTMKKKDGRIALNNLLFSVSSTRLFLIAVLYEPKDAVLRPYRECQEMLLVCVTASQLCPAMHSLKCCSILLCWVYISSGFSPGLYLFIVILSNSLTQECILSLSPENLCNLSSAHFFSLMFYYPVSPHLISLLLWTF